MVALRFPGGGHDVARPAISLQRRRASSPQALGRRRPRARYWRACRHSRTARAAAYSATFFETVAWTIDEKYAPRCNEIRLDAWQRRGWGHRLVDTALYVFNEVL